MAYVDSSQPVISVTSPITNFSLIYKDQAASPTHGRTKLNYDTQKPYTSTLNTESTIAHNRKSSKSSSTNDNHQTSPIASNQSQCWNIEKTHSNRSALVFMYKHQLDVPAIFITAVLFCHFCIKIPLAETFLVLQNKDAVTGLYSKAWTDLNFIFFWIVAFTFLRAFFMGIILKPIAIWFGVNSQHKQNRFQEEGWVFIYYSLSWTAGMYVMRHSPLWNSWTFWFKPEKIFEGYPHTQLPYRTLWYYYVQLGFWLQQLFVLNIEAPRKDFWALLAHHTITLLLITGSAISNFWRAGNAVFVVMDVSDIILAFSKSIKYLGVRDKICDFSFGCFMISWLYTRHYMYAYILYGFMYLAYDIIPFELNIYEGKWYCRELAWLPVLGLGLLQVLMVYWFALILRILIKIIKGHSAEDERSDDECESITEEK